jgi:NitT/TauT family transport system substrate-binding protein
MTTRRNFVLGMGAAGLAGISPYATPAEAAPETNRIRVAHILGGTCSAPQYVAESLLRAEGFSDLRYVKRDSSAKVYGSVASGEIDLSMSFITPFITSAETSGQVVMLAGIHPGCIEMLASERVRTVRDLKGKTVSVISIGGADHGFASTILAHVGLDPRKDVKWIAQPHAQAVQQLTEGKVDACIATPPRSFELRAKKIGHVIVNMTTDRPWSQYFCCVMTGNREFIGKHPIATKRALRAMLKATDLCSSSPESSAKVLASSAFGYREDAALQTMREVSYGRWRELDIEDTVRFYSLRLREAGMIQSTPQKIIAQGCDWRFVNDLKKELKA